MTEIKSKETQSKFEWASLAAIACYVGMAALFVEFIQDTVTNPHGVSAKSKLVFFIANKIPEWLVSLLGYGSWAVLFVLIGNYCKKAFDLNTKLLPVLAIAQACLFSGDCMNTDNLSDVEGMKLFIRLFVASFASLVVMLIVGVKMSITPIDKKIVVAFIVYPILAMIAMLIVLLLSMGESSEKSLLFPYILGTGAEFLAFFLISRVFGKMSDEEDSDSESGNKVSETPTNKE